MFALLARDFREIIAELKDYRELLWLMTRRDIVIRYRRAVLGFAWAIFTPVVNMVVFTIVFNRVAKIQTDVPYPVFAYAGLLPWSLLSSSLKCSDCFAGVQQRAGLESGLSPRALSVEQHSRRGVDFVAGRPCWPCSWSTTAIAPTWTIVFLPVILLGPGHVHDRSRVPACDREPILPRRQIPVSTLACRCLDVCHARASIRCAISMDWRASS